LILLPRRECHEHITAPLSVAYRSSWANPEWMLMLGKLQETRSLSNSIARATDFTNMTTSRRIKAWWWAIKECLYLVEFKGVEQIV
jgi:hypothetical protein